MNEWLQRPSQIPLYQFKPVVCIHKEVNEHAERTNKQASVMGKKNTRKNQWFLFKRCCREEKEPLI